MKQGGQEDKGESARLQNFLGGIAVGDMLKSTLGPRGMDKIMVPMNLGEGAMQRESFVTNDGATIMQRVWMDNPAGKILVDVSMRQDQECGDGTTGVVVLAAELLRRAERLVEKKVHPQVVIDGYRMALQEAKRCLKEQVFDHSGSEDQLRTNLGLIARTTLSSKLLDFEKTHFADLAVSAVLRLKDRSNLEMIHVIKKKGSSLKASSLEDGFILEKKLGVGQPKMMENCKIMVANTPMDADKVKVSGCLA